MSDIVYVCLVHETWRESVAKDAVSFVAVVAIIGLGVFLHSTAMQWFGFFAVLCGILKSTPGSPEQKREAKRTPQEAADYLKSKYGVTAK